MCRPIINRLSLLLFSLALLVTGTQAQGTSGSLTGNVADSTGAVIPGVAVQLVNPVSGYERTTTTDAAGTYHFYNIPFNTYRVVFKLSGFNTSTRSVEISSGVPITISIQLGVETSSTNITVETGSDLVENDPTAHTDIDRHIIDRLPLESQSSSLSSLVTLASPGVAADSNGLFHGLGDHAENSFSVDGQPITDQQSKVFSNQLPSEAVQSLTVISGAPTAEFGDKTSLIIVATTRSGQGFMTPHGSIYGSYGTFGSANGGGDLSYGGTKWGNFLAISGLNTGRFLDGPEFQDIHDRGNEQNIFDRVDYQFSDRSSVHTNMQYTRSWFQTPNSYDTSAVFDQFGNPVGPTDQRSKIETFNIAPTYTLLPNKNTIFNFGGFVRRDAFNYYPSNNPLADLGPSQQETVGQTRTLTNAGLRSDLSYIKGIHNVKIGAVYQQTFLRENNRIGVVDPTLNSPCLDANGNPIIGFSDPSQCSSTLTPNTGFNPILLSYDLTRGGSIYAWHGQTDVKQLAMYVQDQITAGNWVFNVGIRGDLYNGLAVQRQAQPRVGTSYTIKRTNTVLRALLRKSHGDSLQRELGPVRQRLCRSCATGCLRDAWAVHSCTIQPRLPQRVPRRLAAGVRQTPRL